MEDALLVRHRIWRTRRLPPDFSRSITRKFFDFIADVSPGPFNAPSSASELSNALSLCHDFAPGQDGLPYSAFQKHLPWWHHMLLKFFNLVLRWNVVPSSWKLIHVVPVFKTQPSQTITNIFRWRPAHSRSSSGWCMAGSHRTSRIECQGGFRWGADVCVYGLLDTLRLREDVHTFCAFVIRRAFDTSWVGRRLSGCTRLGSLEACGVKWPISLWHPVSGTYLRHGSTRVLLRDVCSHNFFSTYWSTALQHLTCFTWCPTRSTLRSPFHVSTLRR